MDLFLLKFMISAMTLLLIIVHFPFLDGGHRLTSYGVCIYVHFVTRFVRVCNHVTGFNARNLC